MKPLSVQEVLALPAAVPLVDAGRALGVGRTKCHELARSGEWPTELLRFGGRYRVRRTDLLALLGIDDIVPANGNGADPPKVGPASPNPAAAARRAEGFPHATRE